MQITRLENGQIQIGNDVVFASDLIAALAATVGPADWLKDLIDAHNQLSRRLMEQNFGDIASEAYAEERNVGLEMENLSGAIANALMNIRQ